MKDDHKGAIEVSVIFHEGQRMFAVPKQPAPVESVAVKHMRGWVETLKRQSDYGQHMRIPGLNAGACFELAIELEQFINTTPPAAPVQEPMAWKWHQAPVKTSWGHQMVVADLAIDKDHTVSIYCERDQKAKVEAMFAKEKNGGVV